MDEAKIVALEYADKYGPAFIDLKKLLRQSVVNKMAAREAESIREFVRIWYLPETRENLKKIEIRP
jgi:hypothetical protein